MKTADAGRWVPGDRESARAGSPSRGIDPLAGELAQALAKPRDTWTVEDLLRLVQERGIRLVSLMHVGGDGWLKVLDFVPGNESHLRDVLTGGERADGSSLFSGLRSGASDIILRPRLDTAFLDPFSPTPSLVLLCGHAGRDGRPLPESPDTIVHRAYDRLRDDLGVDLWALGEIEYFLARKAVEAEEPRDKDRGYHATAPMVFGEALRREALVALAGMGVPVKYGHSEVGFVETQDRAGLIWEQHEIELGLAPLPQAAEAMALTRWVLQNLARRQGLRCSFDPMVMEGHAGNGLHVHLSPMARGEHLGGVAPDGSLQEPAQWLIGGLAQIGGALMAFGNRERGSFLRLKQGKEAPNTVVWGQYDRQALIRLPLVAVTESGQQVSAPTIEFRLPDGSAHPHLLLAGIAQAVALGRETPDLPALLHRTASRTPDKERGKTTPVPASAAEVAQALARHRAVLESGSVFPVGLIEETLRQFGG
jgi:glutamine synthetase